jgi:eukaryotic-like serine/threonine-protein kinase
MRRMALTCLIVTTFALVVAVASREAHADTLFRGDSAHTGATGDQAPRQFHRVKWRLVTGGRIVSSPVIEQGVLYVGSDDGYVYAVDARNGQRIWKYRTGGPVSSTPAVAGATVYVVSYDGKVHAIDAKTGAPRWKFATGGERRFEAKHLHGFQPAAQTVADPFDVFLSSPLVVAGRVYVGSGDGNIYALDAASGELQWKFATGDVVHASPAWADGAIVVGSWDSYLYALDARTGAERWRFHGGEDPDIHNQVGFQSSPAIVDGVVYVGCRDSNLYAIDAATGKERWRFNNAGSWVVGSPAVTQGRVIFVTSDSALYIVLDAATGKPVARQEGKAFMFASPTVAGDVVLTGVMNGTLEARDLASGALLWTFATDAANRNEGWILTADGRFNAPLLYTSTWREAPAVAADRQFSIGSVFSTALAVGGTVYFGAADGTLYAIE